MNGRRASRLVLVTICDGILFFFAAKKLLNPSEGLFWRMFAMAVCAGVLGGIVLEIGKRKAARTLNVGIPAILGTILASSLVWLPMLAKLQHWEHPGDAYVGAPYLFGFSLLPLFLACVVELGYRLTNISPNSEAAPRTRIWFVLVALGLIGFLVASFVLSNWR